MRQFDTFNSYLDSSGRILSNGRVVFYDTNSQPCNVYDKDGVNLGNKIATDNAGRLQSQVFLADQDYIIDFQAKNGTTFYSVGLYVNRMPTFTISSGSTTEVIKSVETIASLKTVNPTALPAVGSTKLVQVLGYSAVGDKPIVTYKWVPNASTTDDGGAVIASTAATGNWEIVRTFEHLDVRHYNVFGSTSAMGTSGDANHRTRIAAAQTYANRFGMKLYFPSVGSGTNYYDIGGLSVSYPECDNNVRFVSATGYTSTHLFMNDGTTKVALLGDTTTDKFTLTGTTLHTSQNANNDSRVVLDCTDTLVFDSNYSVDATEEDPVTFSNINVRFTTGQTVESYFKFVNCNMTGSFFGTDTASEVEFEKCAITEELISDPSDTVKWGKCTFTSCRTNINDWSTGENWLKAAKTIMQEDVIDLQGFTVTGNQVYNGDTKVRNGKFSGNLTITNGDLAIYDCTVTGNVTLSEGNTLIATGCTFGGTLPDCQATLKNCTLSAASANVLTLAEGSTVTGCSINHGLTITSNTTLIDSTVKGQLKFVADDDSEMTGIYILRNNLGSLTPIAYHRGYAVADPAPYVNNFYFYDNTVTATSGAPIVIDWKMADSVTGIAGTSMVRLQQGCYVVKDNAGATKETIFKPVMINNLSINYGMANQYYIIDTSAVPVKVRFCGFRVKNWVFSFGESQNTVDYGCTGFKVTSMLRIKRQGRSTEYGYRNPDGDDVTGRFEDGKMYYYGYQSWNRYEDYVTMESDSLHNILTFMIPDHVVNHDLVTDISTEAPLIISYAYIDLCIEPVYEMELNT